jgi:hypothetical protein
MSTGPNLIETVLGGLRGQAAKRGKPVSEVGSKKSRSKEIAHLSLAQARGRKIIQDGDTDPDPHSDPQLTPILNMARLTPILSEGDW